jgi:hypothetical protein
MDKHNVFMIDEAPLIDAIKKYGKGAESKDYEYGVSIYMKRKLEEQYKEPFCITFEVKPGKIDIRRQFKASAEEVHKILREMLQEDTPVDFGLVKGTIDNHEESAFAFQVKKFLGDANGTYNQELLSYIHKVLGKYRPGEASLIVLPSLKNVPVNTGKNIQVDIEYLRKNIVVPNGSFQAVFILVYDNKAIIRQIWPPFE